MIDVLVNSADLVSAFGRLRETWKRLYESAPSGAEAILADIVEDLAVVKSAARLSEDGARYVETAYRIRLNEWRDPDARIDSALLDAAEGVRAGFEMRLRTLRQMESGDEILPDAGKDIRRSAARDVCFFHRLRDLMDPEGEGRKEKYGNLDEYDLEKLSQCFDGRRKMVREELDVPPAAVEAVEYLIRLGSVD